MTIISKLFSIALMLVLMFVISLYDGFVIMKLWEWFIIPAFNAPAVSLAVATGLYLLVRFITFVKPNGVYDPDNAKIEGSARLMHMVSWPSIILLLGYAVKTFI